MNSMQQWFFMNNNNAGTGGREVESGGGGGGGDPLAGIVTPFRFETFYPDSSLNPLYTDTACTVQATTDGATVQGVFDHLTNLAIQADQSNPMKAAALRFVNGLPVLRFDGADDWLRAVALGSIGGQQTYWVLMKSNSTSFNSWYSPLDCVDNTGLDFLWGLFQNGTTKWDTNGPPANVWKNGVELNPVGDFDMGTINEWMVLKVRTKDAGVNASTKGIGQLWQTYYGSFDLAGLIFDDPTKSSEIAAYLEAKRLLLSV